MNRKLNIVDLMGGIGVASMSIIKCAGDPNVNISMYIDNETNNKGCVKAYNSFFKTNFKKTNINKYEFNRIKDEIIDIAVASFPSNSFSDENFSWVHRKSIFWGELYRYSTPLAVYDFCKIKHPKILYVDVTLGITKNEQENNLEKFIGAINSLGYTMLRNNYMADDFNAPQENRSRIALMFFRFDMLGVMNKFKFPVGSSTIKTYKDILLDNDLVSDDYFINDYDWENTYLKDDIHNKKIDYNNPLITKLNTITANYNKHNAGYSAIIVRDNIRRFLTPLEVFRAMGLRDDYYYFLYDLFKTQCKNKKDLDTILYTLAGNSMIGYYVEQLMFNLLNIKEMRVWE